MKKYDNDSNDDNDASHCNANHVYDFQSDWDGDAVSAYSCIVQCARVIVAIFLLLHSFLECHCVSFFRMISLFNE